MQSFADCPAVNRERKTTFLVDNSFASLITFLTLRVGAVKSLINYSPILGVKRDKDGFYWLVGRTDDLLNVSGHLLSTAEVESALGEHKAVAECAAVSVPHAVKGEGIYCFVVLKNDTQHSNDLEVELKNHGNYLLLLAIQSFLISFLYFSETKGWRYCGTGSGSRRFRSSQD